MMFGNLHGFFQKKIKLRRDLEIQLESGWILNILSFVAYLCNVFTETVLEQSPLGFYDLRLLCVVG